VHDALSRLPNPCRDLLGALYFDPSDPSYAVIAARLERSVGSIGPLRGRCLERLRELMVQDPTA
jgi:DNA-directed RNA polymerase specialized sigma24 family protein